MTLLPYLWLIGIGLFAGAYGTLIGAGGGFVLVPILLLLYPHDSPATITSISLAVVFFNALSGSIAYARMGRTDYRSGLMFAAASVPGAVIGSLVVGYFSRHIFDVIFAVLLIALSVFILAQPERTRAEGRQEIAQGAGRLVRRVVDAEGRVYLYSYPLAWALAFAFCVGFVSSLLGIGGGIIHVPVLVTAFTFPAHVATATSHFILVISSFFGTVTHIALGDFGEGWRRTIALSIGVLIGAQAGAQLSRRVRGKLILRLLAVALLFAGVRLLWGGLS